MKVEFVAFKGISWTSKLIRFWTRSSYSHIAYKTERGDLIEAWHFEDGMRWGYSFLSQHTKGTPYEVWALDVDDEKAEEVNKFLEQLADNKVPYDWHGILGFVFKVKDDKSKYFCSEGCALALVKAGIWVDIDTWRVYPGFFVDLMKVSGFEKVEEGIV